MIERGIVFIRNDGKFLVKEGDRENSWGEFQDALIYSIGFPVERLLSHIRESIVLSFTVSKKVSVLLPGRDGLEEGNVKVYMGKCGGFLSRKEGLVVDTANYVSLEEAEIFPSDYDYKSFSEGIRERLACSLFVLHDTSLELDSSYSGKGLV